MQLGRGETFSTAVDWWPRDRWVCWQNKHLCKSSNLPIYNNRNHRWLPVLQLVYYKQAGIKIERKKMKKKKARRTIDS